MNYATQKSSVTAQEDVALSHPALLLQRAASLWPHKIAVMNNEQQFSYQEVYTKACCVTDYLYKHKVTAQDHIVLLLENCLEYHALYYGIWQTGACIIPLNTFLSLSELTKIIDECDPKFIITTVQWIEKFETSNLYNQRCVDGIALLNESAAYRVESLPALFDNPQTACVILYTSGTSGEPKGVMLSAKNIMTNIKQLLSITPIINHEDKILAVLPLFHSFAQNTSVWSALFMGMTIIMVNRIERRAIITSLSLQPTLIIGVPSFFGLLCLLRTLDLSSVRLFISGGDTLSSKIKMGFEILYQRKICNGYGLTEASPFIAAFVQDYAQGSGSVGKLATGIQARLTDAEGNLINDRNVGVLELKGDNIMLGYYKDPEATAQAFHDGWFITGDLATFDEDNNLYIVGRSKDLIISKGINIYPAQIENILMDDVNVLQAAVVGVDDETDGQQVIAFITLKESQKFNDEIFKQDLITSLKKQCAQQLAAYKVPKQIIIIETMPINSLHKINKKELKEYFKAFTV